MGYRSDVLFAVEKTVFNGLRLLNKVPALILKEITYENEVAFYWKFDGVKWYDGYENVQVYQDFITLLSGVLDGDTIIASLKEAADWDSQDPTYAFIRIGGETDDIEEIGCPSLFDISVSVVLDHPIPYQ